MSSKKETGERTHELSAYLLWTRMQAEAGQALEEIIERKEMERRAGEGSFFWGVGNAPSIHISSLARMAKPVDLVFSKMKSKPKAVDTKPKTTVLWRRYIDFRGNLRPLPPYTLITSRGETARGRKTVHYALECFSENPLSLSPNPQQFKPSAFRNAGGRGAPVGASQVTSLLVANGEKISSKQSDYAIDMQARLAGSYWVKLVDPIPLSATELRLIDTFAKETDQWKSLIAELMARSKNADPDNIIPRLL